MNPIAVAIKAKGHLNMLQRAGAILQHYSLTPKNFYDTLSHFAFLLDEFDCAATFPITGVVLARHKSVIEKYRRFDVEFAAHGYYHVDHKQLSLDEQLLHFAKTRRIFEESGGACYGFRSPYLRANGDTLTALRQAGFLYDSSQVMAWDAADGAATDAYGRVLDFYSAISANDYPALPRLENGLVRIPYCVPDDEALIDRLKFDSAAAMSKPWLTILAETYRLGELFTLGLHPERVHFCERPLREVLQRARELSPGVWRAQMKEIACWWMNRTNATVTITTSSDDETRVSVRGPEGMTVLARGVNPSAPTENWDGVYRQIKATEFSLRETRRPFIGVSASSAPALKGFLRQQGYISEPAEDNGSHSIYLDRPQFGYEDERPLLDQIEKTNLPLVRLGRWPHGAHSALCVTGDIDALTIWDYALRFKESSLGES